MKKIDYDLFYSLLEQVATVFEHPYDNPEDIMSLVLSTEFSDALDSEKVLKEESSRVKTISDILDLFKQCISMDLTEADTIALCLTGVDIINAVNSSKHIDMTANITESVDSLNYLDIADYHMFKLPTVDANVSIAVSSSLTTPNEPGHYVDVTVVPDTILNSTDDMSEMVSSLYVSADNHFLSLPLGIYHCMSMIKGLKEMESRFTGDELKANFIKYLTLRNEVSSSDDALGVYDTKYEALNVIDTLLNDKTNAYVEPSKSSDVKTDTFIIETEAVCVGDCNDYAEEIVNVTREGNESILPDTDSISIEDHCTTPSDIASNNILVIEDYSMLHNSILSDTDMLVSMKIQSLTNNVVSSDINNLNINILDSGVINVNHNGKTIQLALDAKFTPLLVALDDFNILLMVILDMESKETIDCTDIPSMLESNVEYLLDTILTTVCDDVVICNFSNKDIYELYKEAKFTVKTFGDIIFIINSSNKVLLLDISNNDAIHIGLVFDNLLDRLIEEFTNYEYTTFEEYMTSEIDTTEDTSKSTDGDKYKTDAIESLVTDFDKLFGDVTEVCENCITSNWNGKLDSILEFNILDAFTLTKTHVSPENSYGYLLSHDASDIKHTIDIPHIFVDRYPSGEKAIEGYIGYLLNN